MLVSVALGVGLAIVAVRMWPQRTDPVQQPRNSDLEPRAPRELSHFQLSSTETLRSVSMPAPDGVSSIVCVIYTSDRTAQLSCPSHDSLDIGQ